MDYEYAFILFVVVISICIAITVKGIFVFRDFAENTRYIRYIMKHANSHEEYRRWRGELRCEYLMLLPFVNAKNVMRVYRFVFKKRG